jgi:hypothetical protein
MEPTNTPLLNFISIPVTNEVQIKSLTLFLGHPSFYVKFNAFDNNVKYA